MVEVAVVVPAYNPGPYLKLALESVVAQSFTDWECVVVDDGSSEDLRWVADVDPRIQLERRANAGVAGARNRGVELTSAPLLAFLDADDIWLGDYLAVQRALFADPSVTLASTTFETIDRHGTVTGPGYLRWRGSYEELLQGCGIIPATGMVRRYDFDRVGGYRDIACEDWDLWLRVARDGGRIAQTDAVLVQYRRHDSNISSDFRSLFAGGREILKQHAHPASRAGMQNLRAAKSRQAFDYARDRQRGLPDRVAALAWAARRDPVYVFAGVLRWARDHIRLRFRRELAA